MGGKAGRFKHTDHIGVPPHGGKVAPRRTGPKPVSAGLSGVMNSLPIALVNANKKPINVLYPS